MNNIYLLFSKWHTIPIEKKIAISWVISILVVVSLSAILFFSKQELHQSSDVIMLNTELRSATQDILASIQKLEISSKRFILTGSKKDSVKYFANLDSLQRNLLRLELLVKDQPRFFKFFLPLQRTIRNELYKINHLSFSIRNAKIFDSEIIRIEENIYKKLDNYWQLLDNEEEQATLEQIQVLHSKINKNLNYFLILIITYISLLTALFVIITSDVKKRRKLAAEVAENKEELNAIINTAPALIFVKNKEKKFELVNKQLLKFFNTSAEKILSRDNSAIVSSSERWLTEEEDDAILNDKLSITNIERNVKLADGKTYWLKINKAPLLDKDNNIAGIVGIMDDITARVEFQEKLIATQKELESLIKQKDKFFSIIAHDLRSPFTGMLGFAEILSEDYAELSEEDKKFYIDNIQKSLKSLLSLIDNLLTWARLNLNRADYNPKEISLAEIVLSVFRSQNIAAVNKKIELQSVFNKNIIAFADAGMIETVIRNLVSNAIKFTNPGGSIKVNAVDQKDSIKIEIEDNGIGMRSDVADSLFNNDTNISTKGTNDEKGTGLGFTICKEFVKKHGGNITVKSEVGKGTIISFILPKKL